MKLIAGTLSFCAVILLLVFCTNSFSQPAEGHQFNDSDLTQTVWGHGILLATLGTEDCTYLQFKDGANLMSFTLDGRTRFMEEGKVVSPYTFYQKIGTMVHYRVSYRVEERKGVAFLILQTVHIYGG